MSTHLLSLWLLPVQGSPGGGFRFGVPLSNFIGWIISGSMGIVIVEYFLGGILRTRNKRLDYGLWLTMIFFVGFIFRHQIIFYFF